MRFSTLRLSRAYLEIVLLIVVLGAVVFYPVFQASFLLWDDPYHLARNPYFQPGGYWNFWAKPYFGLYVPVAYSVWFAVWNWISQEPWIFHAINLGLHEANAIFLFLILHRNLRFSRWVAGLASLVFFLHPLQVESVAWVSELRGLLATLFGLWALRIWLQERISWRQAVVAVCIFALGMLSKPSIAVLPLLVLILKIFAHKIEPGSAKMSGSERTKFLASTVTAIVIATALGLVTYVTQASETVAVYAFVDRVLLAGDSLGWFIAKFFWPHPLVMDYGRSASLILSEKLWIPSLLLIAAADAALLVGFKFLGLHRNLRFWTGLGLLIAWWLPNSGVLSAFLQDFSLVADRYFYGAMVGVAVLLAIFLERVKDLKWVLGVGLIVWAGLSWQQAKFWQSDESLFSHTLEFNPQSFFALNNLGQAYVNAGKPMVAEPLLNAARSLRPDEAGPILSLMLSAVKREDHEKVITLARNFLANARAVELNHDSPQFFDILSTLGYSLAILEKWPEAQAALCESLRLNPLRAFDAATEKNLKGVEEQMRKSQKSFVECPY